MSRKILVTGFGPFGAHRQNPTEVCLRQLNAECDDPNLKVLVLPVDYQTAFDMLNDAINEHMPDFILMLGLSLQAPCFRLERVAQNRVSTSNKDICGFSPENTRILQDAADSFETNVNLPKLAEHLIAYDFDLEISKDAGDYLCNYLYFRTLHEISCRNLSTQALFIHSPLSEEIAFDEGLDQQENIKTIPESSLDNLVRNINAYFLDNVKHGI